MDDAEARRRFAAARVARLATVRPDGSPHLVPVVFALDDEVVHTIVDAKPKRARDLARLHYVRANPRVSLLVDAYDEAWSRLWWVRADGVGEVVERGASRDRSVALLRARYPQYLGLPDTAFGAALLVRIERWTAWAGS